VSLTAAKKLCYAQAAALLADLDARARAGLSTRLVLHAFSNTGWIAYARFVQILAAAAVPVAGAVLDSCPHPEPSSKVWAAGFVTAVRPGGAPDPKSALYRATRLFMRAWLGWGSRKAELARMVRDEREAAGFPQLYIFSANDHVIPARSVRAVVADRAARGVPVTALELADSPHVQHLREHAAEYEAALAAFDSALAARAAPAARAPAPLRAIAASGGKTVARTLSLSKAGGPGGSAATGKSVARTGSLGGAASGRALLATGAAEP
jgi:hypothetical protein